MATNPLRDIFAERLRSTRRAAGLSQLALASAAGMDRKTVNRMEQATVPVTLDQLDALASALNVAPAGMLLPNTSPKE
ncbi:helix-turn-helix domain-containing protein [Spelaeicoccus albus]|uniref:Transcriptional regulator with XRE-family HTH domain n=1 Tax=Spelaeicoccus albus TaxID=1280376 RepID=A0A7Z0A7Z6_9MICO|nr:helix-turn-helix transcriptional regulator [Spelaeicoccus albus]NYI66109.1 transcriptional regulator with XRE-family HTH domain [Spelaeicoccus albus]